MYIGIYSAGEQLNAINVIKINSGRMDPRTIINENNENV